MIPVTAGNETPRGTTMNQRQTNKPFWEAGFFAEVSGAVIVGVTAVHGLLALQQLPLVTRSSAGSIASDAPAARRFSR